MHYHSGAMLKGKWSCCKHREKATLGCQPTYHLLTRSSSRYAQIRRRDTLTSSTNSHRRSLGSNHSHYGTFDRRANTMTVPSYGTATHGETKPGQGLSNSCIDLSLHRTVHHPEAFLVRDDVITQSQCSSSQFSTTIGPLSTISTTSITLNRVSVPETSGSEFDYGEQTTTTRVEPPKGSPKMADKRRIRCRQVAPEASTTTVSRFPLEVEEKSVAVVARKNVGTTTSTPDRPRAGRSLDTQLMSNIQKSASLKDSTRTYTLPRQQKFTTASPLTGSVQYIPSARTAAVSKTTPTTSSGGRLKHSNTFVVSNSTQLSQVGTAGSQVVRGVLKSRSTSALTKPVIEPRISSSDPSVVHV